jgi:hypothetical protein
MAFGPFTVKSPHRNLKIVRFIWPFRGPDSNFNWRKSAGQITSSAMNYGGFRSLFSTSRADERIALSSPGATSRAAE